MRRLKIIGVIAVLAMVVAACGGDSAETTTTTAAAATTTAAEATTAATRRPPPATARTLSPSYGETRRQPTRRWSRRRSDRSTHRKRTAGTSSWPRSPEPPGPRRGDHRKAMECWNNQECDTGSGGELIMGYADGGGA
jgi:hypothetical protein